MEYKETKKVGKLVVRKGGGWAEALFKYRTNTSNESVYEHHHKS